MPPIGGNPVNYSSRNSPAKRKHPGGDALDLRRSKKPKQLMLSEWACKFGRKDCMPILMQMHASLQEIANTMDWNNGDYLGGADGIGKDRYNTPKSLFIHRRIQVVSAIC